MPSHRLFDIAIARVRLSYEATIITLNTHLMFAKSQLKIVQTTAPNHHLLHT